MVKSLQKGGHFLRDESPLLYFDKNQFGSIECIQ